MASFSSLMRKLSMIKTVLDNEGWHTQLQSMKYTFHCPQVPNKTDSFLFCAETDYFRLSRYSGCSPPFADQWWCFLSYHNNTPIVWLAWLNTWWDVPCLMIVSLSTSETIALPQAEIIKKRDLKIIILVTIFHVTGNLGENHKADFICKYRLCQGKGDVFLDNKQKANCSSNLES